MNEPDDGWGDLAKELGVDSGPKSNPPPPADDDADALDEMEDTEVVSGLAGEEADDEDGDETEGEGEGEGTDESPKKKRRRRRRRKKKGGPEVGDAPAAAAEDDAPTGFAEGEGDADEESDGDEENGPRRAPAEEGVTAEAARELIANWNVPSWAEIVGGLYRPPDR